MENDDKSYFKKKLWRNIVIILAIVVILVIAFVVYSQRVDVDEFISTLVHNYGLVGLFIATVIVNASVFVIIPIDFVVFLFGTVYNPVVMGVLLGMGAAIGEMTSYLVGMGGREAIQKTGKVKEETLEKIKEEIGNKGIVVIILGSMTPFPFDLIGVAAGMIHYNVYKFFLGTALGKIVRYGIVAYAGMVGLEIIQKFLNIG